MLKFFHEKYANISFHAYLIVKNMAFSISKDECSANVDINEGNRGSVWKHIIWTVLASIPFLSHGVETAALTTSAHSGHFIPTATDGVPWTTTAAIAASALSAPVYCYVANRFGRKYSVYFISLIQGASCIPLFLPLSDTSSIILHVLAGISSGGLFTVLPAFVRELSVDSWRGVSVSLMASLTTFGYMVRLFLHEEAVLFLMVGLIAVQFLIMFIIPESPSYQVMSGKLEVAKSNLASLKCVKDEHVCVSKALEELKDESDRVRLQEGSGVFKLFKNRIYLDILKIGITLHTVTALCGNIVFLDQEKSLAQLKMGLDPEKMLIVTCLFAGSLACLILVRSIERKYLLSIGFLIMAMSLGVLGVYTQAHLTVTSYRIVPVIALGVLVVGFGIAWALPTVIIVEMLNLEIRAPFLGLIYFYSQVIKLIHVHTFQYIEDYMGIFTLLYIFAGINLFGVVYTLFALPDIKNKNVRQIEKQMKRVPLLHFKTIKV